jgi:hypothetical protein
MMARSIEQREPTENEVTKFAVAARRALKPSQPASFPIINKPCDFIALAEFQSGLLKIFSERQRQSPATIIFPLLLAGRRSARPNPHRIA